MSQSDLSSGLVPVHVGFREPEPSDATRQRNPMFKQRRSGSALRDETFDWSRHDLEPRWIGLETGDCAAALEPSIFHNQGVDELERFRQGAAKRGETAVLVAVVGDLSGEEAPRSLHSRVGDSVLLPGADQSIGGARAPRGASVSLSGDLNDVDRDLGLRLLNSHPPDGRWWELNLSGNTLLNGVAGAPVQAATSGTLEPILVDGLDHAVAAVWTPAASDERWYVIPDGADWHTVLDWLVTQALPEYVPGALRRARPALALDASFRTEAEADASERLAALDADYELERARLLTQLEQAETAAAPIREGLLFGTSTVLEDAVASVLREAGLSVVGLDQALGDTSSADLLVGDGSERMLVEVKSASGRANESLVAKLLGHLQTWEQVAPEEPVSGGVLIVNHQHRLNPSDRDTSVYQRKEFTASLTIPVISAVELFRWWRDQDWAAIHAAMFPASAPFVHAIVVTETGSDARPAPIAEASPSRRRWFQRGSRPSA